MNLPPGRNTLKQKNREYDSKENGGNDKTKATEQKPNGGKGIERQKKHIYYHTLTHTYQMDLPSGRNTLIGALALLSLSV